MSKVITASGRRKRSTAQIKMVPGSGKITVNGKDVREYFPFEVNVMNLMQPLEATNTVDSYDIDVVVRGGGYSGQTEAIRLAIAKALLNHKVGDVVTVESPNGDYDVKITEIK